MTPEGRPMVWLRLIVCLTLVGGVGSAQAQTPGSSTTPPTQSADPPALTISLDRLQALLTRVPNASLSVNFAEWRLRVVVSKLQNLAKNWPAQSPADYRASLDRSVRALEGAIVARSPERMQDILEALADDLEVKLEHCTESGGKLGGLVAVSVRTVQGEQESKNWQVFYLPKVYEALGGASPDRFPQLSSPTLESLVPGRYVMWVTSQAGDRTSEKTVVKVGEGKKELLLDLVVPTGTTR